MHAECLLETATWYKRFEPILRLGDIAEIGSLNINGTVRSIIPQRIIGFDVVEGDGVDIVINEGLIPDDHTGKYGGVVSLNAMGACADKTIFCKQLYDVSKPGALLFLCTCSNYCKTTHSSSEKTIDKWRFDKAGLEAVLADYFVGCAYYGHENHSIYYTGVRR
jgi:hypothetical protein